MTNEKAIEILNPILESAEKRVRVELNFLIPELIEALQMAINALSDKNKLTCLECECCVMFCTCDHKKDS